MSRQRGARGDFISIILKSPYIPLYQKGIKTTETEGLALWNITSLEGLTPLVKSGSF